MSDLKPCHCGGEVMHLIRDEEESIIECQKCGEITDIEKLWNAQSNKHPADIQAHKTMHELHEAMGPIDNASRHHDDFANNRTKRKCEMRQIELKQAQNTGEK